MESDRTLSAPGDEYNPDILHTTNEPRSVQKFSEMLDIPIATYYRRIEEPMAAELLGLYSRVLPNEHRRTNVYRREVSEIVVRFKGDDYMIGTTERSEVKSKLGDVWRKITRN